MFFILSKILAFLISPFSWIAIGLIYAIISKIPERKKKALIISGIIFLLFSNEFVAEEVIRGLEAPNKNLSQKEHFDVGIVLGGMINYDGHNKKLIFNSNIDRLLQALILYRKGHIDKILISGGSGDITYPEIVESKLLLDFVKDLGFDEKDIWIETKSRNTRENATYSYEFLKTKFDHPEKRKYLLITSATHMKRSLACFTKAGLKTDDYSTSRISGPRRFSFQNMLIPNIWAFGMWEIFFHETIGYWTYKIAGYI
ncbi:MAG: YdcF family protein [Bacteroidetes bacterium]|nr:YdcF family protein [Bacteroidota bacterium]